MAYSPTLRLPLLVGLTCKGLAKMKEKLEAEADPGARVVSVGVSFGLRQVRHRVARSIIRTPTDTATNAASNISCARSHFMIFFPVPDKGLGLGGDLRGRRTACLYLPGVRPRRFLFRQNYRRRRSIVRFLVLHRKSICNERHERVGVCVAFRMSLVCRECRVWSAC